MPGVALLVCSRRAAVCCACYCALTWNGVCARANVHSNVRPHALCVTSPAPSYMLQFSSCPGSPHNPAGARSHCCPMVMPQGMARGRSLWHARLLQRGNQRHATPVVRTHTHARAHARAAIACTATCTHPCPDTPRPPATPLAQGTHPAARIARGHCQTAMPDAWAAGTHAFSQHRAHTRMQSRRASCMCAAPFRNA